MVKYGKEYHAAWRARNPERVAAAARKYREAHRLELNARRRAYVAAHREQEASRNSKYHVANRDAIRDRKNNWNHSHPEGPRARRNRRRARLMKASGSHTVAQWLDKCELLGNVCIYCGEARPLERDHKVPLIRGGSDDISNIVPACRSCNSKKRTRTSSEYLSLKLARG